MPTSQVALGFSLSIALVLAPLRPAQAFETKCATPTHPKALHPFAKPLSPQTTFAQEHGSKLGTCKVWVGLAKLGGENGILATSIDPKQNKTTLFCRGATAKDCLLRATKPQQQPTAWRRGFLKTTPMGRGQFAYKITKENDGELVIILFGPDLKSYLHHAPGFGTDLAQ